MKTTSEKSLPLGQPGARDLTAGAGVLELNKPVKTLQAGDVRIQGVPGPLVRVDTLATPEASTNDVDLAHFKASARRNP